MPTDPRRLEELAAKHRRFLFWWFSRQAGVTVEDAEDMASETLLKAFHHIDTFHGECSERHWISQIACNLWRDVWRKRRRSIQEEEEGEGEAPDRAAGPARQVEVAELRRDVRRAVAELSPSKRRTVTLYLCGLEYPQIAALTGWPLGTVKSRMHHAKARLRRKLRGKV